LTSSPSPKKHADHAQDGWPDKAAVAHVENFLDASAHDQTLIAAEKTVLLPKKRLPLLLSKVRVVNNTGRIFDAARGF